MSEDGFTYAELVRLVSECERQHAAEMTLEEWCNTDTSEFQKYMHANETPNVPNADSD